MINYNKYTNDGWGLSIQCMQSIEKLINEKSLTNAIEFGSGQSTHFLNEIGINYISFEDDVRFSAKGCKNVYIRELKQLTDVQYNKIIDEGEYDYDLFNKLLPHLEKTSRQKNCFYNIKKGDISDTYDLIILDGPNGNGRNIAFSFIKPFVKDIFYIVVDDYDHYDFIEILKKTYMNVELYHSYYESGNNPLRDRFEIYKVEL